MHGSETMPVGRVRDGALDLLKWLALLSMVLDHLRYVGYSVDWLYVPGRLAFPWFCLAMAANLARGPVAATGQWRYLGWLVLFSAVSEIPYRLFIADADTLKQLLVNPALQQATRGRVLIVDEAGLVSVREMRDLCRLAAANDNRLLLVGDIKQHNSVEAGDAVRCLQKYARVPVVRLTEIRRQKDPRYRAAVARLARGDAFGAQPVHQRLQRR